ncbi:phosphonoacetaldehyde phosphonohydrolase-related protein [Pseudomonas sp. UM16]|uniref:phosphonoacetaldehyde phosphonohydrolase-related protein n=1 Tax=Pseudomonas sp. UM16 TaxID=3158962 RepID=UPI0039902254
MQDSPAITALLFGLRGCLIETDTSPTRPRPTPGALQTLAWLDELPAVDAEHLAAALPAWLKAHHVVTPWPAPDACWQALMALNTTKLEGCVLVSAEPRLLQSGLNAGLWTIGLASCGSRNTYDSPQEQERQRGKATLQLFALGVHSVIDHLEALGDCLADIRQRRLKGEKP